MTDTTELMCLAQPFSGAMAEHQASLRAQVTQLIGL